MGTIAERFWSKVEKTEGCWLWTGARSSTGYGSISSGGRAGRTLHAHRVSYEIHFGAIPPGLEVCHRCDVRHCVRPDHLFLGTRSDNMRDCAAKGRDRGYRWSSGKHPLAKLTPKQVAEIRARRSRGELRGDVAKAFGVSKSAITAITNGVNWRHT